MTHLILVKHSLPQIIEDKPAREWLLSEDGQKRCHALADNLAAYKPDVIVTSSEPKARETGEITARLLGVSCQTIKNLHEHERRTEPFGTRAEFEARVRRFFEQPDKLTFGEETANAARDRFAQALNETIEQNSGKKVVVVAHGTVITLFVAQHNAIEPFEFWQKLDLPSFVVLSLPDFKIVTLCETILN